MKLIAHRRNTVAELIDTPRSLGVEVDIRSRGDLLIAQHEPYVDGTDFAIWLDSFDHGTLILNVKEEGLEERLLKLMNEREIEDFFFLDQTFPLVVKWAALGETRIAVRVSEYESIETVFAVSGMCQWVWVDCFSNLPVTSAEATRLKEAGFRLCLASPELHGNDPEILIPKIRSEVLRRGVEVDAVCSKRPDLWLNMDTR